MIISKKPISMSEVLDEIKRVKTEEKELADFVKKFSKTNAEDAKKLKGELMQLELLKLKDEQIVKIIDILPETSGELNKIFTNVTLDDNESKRVLDVVKKFK